METGRIDSILRIASRESGGDAEANELMADIFGDSLDWVSFIQCLRNEVGPIDDDQLIECETFQDLADAYALPS